MHIVTYIQYKPYTYILSGVVLMQTYCGLNSTQPINLVP